MLNCGGCNVVDRSTLIVVLCLLHPFQQYTRQQCMLLASQMHATSLIRQHTRSPALFLDTSCTGCGTPGSGPANCKAPTPSSSVLAAGWMEKVIHSGISISAWMMAAPQMGRCTPLMKLAASEARNRMGPAISIGVDTCMHVPILQSARRSFACVNADGHSAVIFLPCATLAWDGQGWKHTNTDLYTKPF